MIRTFAAIAIITASITPAMAEGKEDTLAIIGMTIAKNECGLSPTDIESARASAQRSMSFTGLSRGQYITLMGEMVAFKTNEMYANKSIGKFCVKMANIYAEFQR